MKKKVQIFYKDLKMPHLFREDLENIENVIKQELSPNRYKLESESFEYTGMSEIKDKVKETTEFRIESHAPDVIIVFTRKKASIHAHDDSVETMGAIKKVLDIVTKGERRFLFYSSHIGYLIAPILIIFSSLILYRPYIIGDLLETTHLILILLFSIIWFVIIVYVVENQFSLVEFTYKEDKSNFLSRNKDQLFLGILIAIASFLLGKFL